MSRGKRDNNAGVVSSPVSRIALTNGANCFALALALRVDCTVTTIAPAACAVIALMAVAAGFFVDFAVDFILNPFKVLRYKIVSSYAL